MSSAAAAPADSEAFIGRDFAVVMRSKGAAFGLVIGASIALVAGAALAGPVAAVIAPLSWCTVMIGCLYLAARTTGERKFFIAYSESAGLDYAREWELFPLTPLLGAGDARRVTHYMTGPLRGEGGELRCGLGLLTVEKRRGENSQGQGAVKSASNYTFCAVDIEAGLTRFPGIYLYPHKDLLDHLSGEGTMSTSGLKRLEVESVAFGERYDLWAVPDQDEIVARRLFTPSLVVWLAEHPLQPYFEYSAGTLLVFVRGRLHDTGHLDYLLDAARHLGARFAAEAAE